eukprot:TRINITY_DN13918_c0_g1_i4.p3 TRINITY_DN13918_c0_g1~~TRINITY_DN13918_c0_g1_i4.p3  ORF type:complete len:111 (+),score=29.48 TRINITY_DN13918_c0_g1_i4:645-977(+)
MNLGITDMTIKGYNNIGGIAGFTKGKYSFKLIENCFVQAKITGNENIGGLVGYNDSGIYYSYSVTWLEGKDQEKMGGIVAVSYTHLTLPTILLVQISVVAVSLKKKKNEV